MREPSPGDRLVKASQPKNEVFANGKGLLLPGCAPGSKISCQASPALWNGKGPSAVFSRGKNGPNCPPFLRYSAGPLDKPLLELKASGTQV